MTAWLRKSGLGMHKLKGQKGQLWQAEGAGKEGTHVLEMYRGWASATL